MREGLCFVGYGLFIFSTSENIKLRGVKSSLQSYKCLSNAGNERLVIPFGIQSLLTILTLHLLDMLLNFWAEALSELRI